MTKAGTYSDEVCVLWVWVDPATDSFTCHHRQAHDHMMDSLLEFGQAEDLDEDEPVLKVQRQLVAIG